MAHILLVDDDATTLESFEAILRIHDFEVTTSTSGIEALECIRNASFDVILADLRLRDMSGVRLLELVRSDVKLRIPFIIVTGCGTVRSAVDALKFGAMDYLEKPLPSDELIKAVRCACESDTRASVKDPRVRAVLNIIGSRYADTRLTARLVARELGVSHEYLSRLIKTNTGHSFGYALNSVRTAMARDLLLTSSFSVKEIATVVGYQTTHHLDRYFRRRFGVTPTRVRRSEAK